MSNSDISGFGRGTYGQGAWNTELPVIVTGVAGTSALGSETVVAGATVSVTGVAGTSALGSETVIAAAVFSVTGVAGTSALGSVTASIGADVIVTGVSATGGIGTVLLWSDVDTTQVPSWAAISTT